MRDIVWEGIYVQNPLRHPKKNQAFYLLLPRSGFHLVAAPLECEEFGDLWVASPADDPGFPPQPSLACESQRRGRTLLNGKERTAVEQTGGLAK